MTKMSAVLQETRGTYQHSLSIKEYHTLWKAGLLDERIELIDGVIYNMAPIGTKHVNLTNLLTMELTRRVDHSKWTIQIQAPVQLSNYSEPEPDICIINKSANELIESDRVITSADVYMIIEVANTTLRHDTSIKAPLYAKNGILNYWIFDIKGKQLLIYSDPQNGRYQHKEIIAASDNRALEVLPELVLPVCDYLKKLG